MKKVNLVLMGLLLNAFAFAYNPPVGSQAMFNNNPIKTKFTFFI